jgi:transposase InsO family protein
MGWKVTSQMEARKTFIEWAEADQQTFADLCRAFGISRKTGYKWLKRYRATGEAGLVERSSQPHHSPQRTSAALETVIVGVRERHPVWGGRKIHAYLKRQGLAEVPAPSTITDILHRHALINLTDSVHHQSYRRFEYAAPNQLWQMDFKGHIALGDGQRCHPLTVLDDHSRFLLALHPCAAETEILVRTHLTTLFGTYGLPERMLMDNGQPWGATAEFTLTTLTAWLIRLGIRVLHGRPAHPQTQGKEERLHRTLKAELLSRQTFASLPDCLPAFTAWQRLYTYERPHVALDHLVPADRYTPSPRPFPESLPPLVYLPTDILRKVDSSGKISFKGRAFRISRALCGEYVALRPTPSSRLWDVWFAHCWVRHLSFPSTP